MAFAEKVLRAIYYKIPGVDPLTKWKKRGLTVGRNFTILDGVEIDSSHCWLITIGNNVTLAPGVRILAHDASTKIHLNYTRIGKVNIGDNVFVGADSIILPSVSIGNNAVIGAGSIVAANIEENTVAAGNPAKFICTLEDYLERKKKEMIQTPRFGYEYTLGGKITEQMKKEMIQKMSDRIGYVE